MKLLSTLGFASAAILAASTAFATPQYNTQYTGNTYGSEISNGSPAGYYVWNDAASPSDWHIRWTGTGAAGSSVDWFGRIEFHQSALGTTTPFQLELNDVLDVYSNSPMLGGNDLINWSAVTDTSGHIDGIDFSLLSDVELMEFNLGSTLYKDLPIVTNDSVLGTQIFIGYGLATPNVNITNASYLRNNRTKYGKEQSFEIHVAEPGTLALFGLGISGLLLSARRKKSA